MKFERYQHVERLGTDEVEGILNGTVYVFPKLDGSNFTAFVDDKGKPRAGSRNRIIDIGCDNQGACAYFMAQDKFKKFFEKYPTVRIYAEWLVPHHIKDYEDDAWRKVYVFDVMKDERYLRYEEYKGMLEEFNIEYIPVLAVLNSPTEEEVRSLVDQATFLCKEGTYGEGVVCKNYDFVNKYGRITWAKVVRETFKAGKRAGKPIDYCTEVDIVEKLCTPEYIEKEFAKIANETGGFSSKMIPRLLGSVWHIFITEEAWNMVKKYKNPKIDFSLLNRLVIDKVKEVKKEFF